MKLIFSLSFNKNLTKIIVSEKWVNLYLRLIPELLDIEQIRLKFKKVKAINSAFYILTKDDEFIWSFAPIFKIECSICARCVESSFEAKIGIFDETFCAFWKLLVPRALLNLQPILRNWTFEICSLIIQQFFFCRIGTIWAK